MGRSLRASEGSGRKSLGKDPRVDAGKEAEGIAARHLALKGYRLLERRYRLRNGEIDLIVEDGSTIVFVEVRCRMSRLGPAPEESVTARKRALLIRAARIFLLKRGLHDRPCRFDVVAVERGERGEAVRHLEDAFRADG